MLAVRFLVVLLVLFFSSAFFKSLLVAKIPVVVTEMVVVPLLLLGGTTVGFSPRCDFSSNVLRYVQKEKVKRWKLKGGKERCKKKKVQKKEWNEGK